MTTRYLPRLQHKGMKILRQKTWRYPRWKNNMTTIDDENSEDNIQYSRYPHTTDYNPRWSLNETEISIDDNNNGQEGITSTLAAGWLSLSM
jgi:hypothetical protein